MQLTVYDMIGPGPEENGTNWGELVETSEYFIIIKRVSVLCRKMWRFKRVVTDENSTIR